MILPDEMQCCYDCIMHFYDIITFAFNFPKSTTNELMLILLDYLCRKALSCILGYSIGMKVK